MDIRFFNNWLMVVKNSSFKFLITKHNYIFQQNDIKNLPDIVDSQYAIGRGVRSEEEIQEIQALPDM